jgi:CHAT domain-containing protein
VATIARGGRATIAPLSPQEPRQLEEAVSLLLDQLRHPDQEGWRASEQMYQMLISPVAKEIQGHKRRLVIPSGLLYYLPFGGADRTWQWAALGDWQ